MSWAKRAMDAGAKPPLPGVPFARKPASQPTKARHTAYTTGMAFNLDITDAIRYIEKKNKDVGLTAVAALKMLAVEMAGAMATSTRISPHTRPIVKKNPKGENKVEARTFFAKGFVNGVPTFKRIWAETAAEARQHPLAKIKRRGLARQAWFWIIRTLGEDSENSGFKGGLLPSTYNVYRNDEALEIRMTNRLRYADQAFFSKGRATVENAGQRILGRVKKRMHYLRMVAEQNAGAA